MPVPTCTRWAATLAAGLVVVTAGPASAAGDPLKEATAAEKAHDWDAAVAALQASMRDKPSAKTALRLAAALENAGRLVDALAQLRAVEADRKLGAAAKAKREALAKRIPTLIIELAASDGVSVTIDGEEIPVAALESPVPVDPGEHVVVAKVAGGKSLKKRVTLAAAGREVVRFDLPSPTPEKPADAPTAGHATEGAGSSRETWAWVLGGVGVGAIASGTYFGLAARGGKDRIDAECPGNVCPPQDASLVRSTRNQAAISTVSFVAGGGCVLMAIALAVSGSGEEAGGSPGQGVTVRPWIGLGDVGVGGRF